MYERGLEHYKDLKYRRPRSHLLRHAVEFHQNECPDEINFKMKALSYHKSAFERQISEAVLINESAGLYSMNSKIEYSRTMLPKISLKMGKNSDQKEDREVTREKTIIDKIKMLYKSENKRENDNVITLDEDKMENAIKRRKLESPSVNQIISTSDHLNITMSDCYSTNSNSYQLNITKSDCYSPTLNSI